MMCQESINLLTQSYTTLKNVHYLLKKKEVVDANTLLRAWFENLIMAMMIKFDINVYNEFKDLNINDENRKYTKQQYLRNSFKKKLKLIDNELFGEMSNNMLGKILDELYNKLCLYTHSILIVNMMNEVIKNKDEDLFIIFFKQNTYFLEILLYSSLNYITNYKKFRIDYLIVALAWIQLFNKIDKNKYTKDYLEKYNEYIYIGTNKEYIENNKRGIEKLQKESKILNDELKEKPIAIFNILEKLFE